MTTAVRQDIATQTLDLIDAGTPTSPLLLVTLREWGVEFRAAGQVEIADRIAAL